MPVSSYDTWWGYLVQPNTYIYLCINAVTVDFIYKILHYKSVKSFFFYNQKDLDNSSDKHLMKTDI